MAEAIKYGNAPPTGVRAARILALGALLSACARSASPGPTPPEAGTGAVAVADATADSVREVVVAPGITHRVLWYDEGPWAVHAIEIDLRSCGIELRTAKGLGRVVGRETTSAMAQRVADTLGQAVLVAINADFFSFDPPGLPRAAQVVAGEVVTGGGTTATALEEAAARERPVFAMTEDGRPVLGTTRLDGAMRVTRRAPLRLAGANARPPADGVTVYDRWWGPETPSDSGVVELVVRRTNAQHAVGDTVRAVLVRVDTATAGVPIADGEAVVAARGSAALALRTAAPGDTVVWWFFFPALPRRIVELVGGYPLLLDDGRQVHALPGISASFADNRHPRTAVGIRDDGRLVLLAVDGRQPGYSEGMALGELAAYMRTLGVRDALNLDGGGSTTIVVRGEVANRPSDAAGERAVANAVLVLGPGPGSCGT